MTFRAVFLLHRHLEFLASYIHVYIYFVIPADFYRFKYIARDYFLSFHRTTFIHRSPSLKVVKLLIKV